MKVIRFGLPIAIPALVLAGSYVVAACSGSATTTPGNGQTPGGGGNDATAGGNDDSSTPNPQPGQDSGGQPLPSGDSGFTIPDGGFTLPSAEAGSLGTILPGTPGQIQCGQSTCDLDASTCCANADGGESCASGTTTKCPQASLHCAQAADCTSGQLCCAQIQFTNLSADSQCQAGPCPTASQFGAQMCATSAECPPGVTCQKQNCQGETLQLCGLFSYSGIVNIKCTAE